MSPPLLPLGGDGDGGSSVTIRDGGRGGRERGGVLIKEVMGDADIGDNANRGDTVWAALRTPIIGDTSYWGPQLQ